MNKQTVGFLNRFLKLYFMIILLFLYIGCENEQNAENGSGAVLARIGDKTISVDEFIRRAEYTVRPNYCRGDNYIHRKIVLNSLIAEKLLALETGPDNELLQNTEFQNYLRGRKEQVMRQWYYHQEAVKAVHLDTNEVRNEYAVAGRTYHVSYFTLPTKVAGDKIKEQLSNQPSYFHTLFEEITGESKIPEKEVRYSAMEDPKIHRHLFLKPVEKGQVIGPLETEDGSQLLIRVKGWKDALAFSDQQVRDRWQMVRESITNRKAMEIYENKVLHMMKGKQILFNKDIFIALVNIVGTEYYITDEQKKLQYNKKFWGEDGKEMIIDDQLNQLEDIKDKALFSIDGEIWMVQDLFVELQSHPLVFRKKRFPKKQFAEQFKLAIVDMIRDKYITEDAYKKSYDEEKGVTQNYEMWKDNLLALYQKQKILQAADTEDKNNFEIITDELDPYVKRLFDKYNDLIEIDVKRFEETQLTKIDMFVIQKNVPFPIMVPSFPQLTTHNKLDYGKSMKMD